MPATMTHAITTKLNKSFITPFDREDIYTAGRRAGRHRGLYRRRREGDTDV